MSDIQDLIHKTSIYCIKQGERQATERIIKLLEEQITKCPCEPECQADDPVDVSDLIALIKGEK